MKVKIYGATGSFPRCIRNEELAEKIYHYQKKINENQNFNNFLKLAGIDISFDETGMIPFEIFKKFLYDNFDFWIGRTYGGDTSSIYIKTDDEKYLIFDAGSGLIKLSKDILNESGFKDNIQEVNIFLTHFHWDHIHGIPFSGLIFTQNKINFYSMPAPGYSLKSILEDQMNKFNFPIPLNFYNKKISYTEIEDRIIIGECTEIVPYEMEHPLVGSYVYRVNNLKTGKSVVYATDFEQPPDKLDELLIEICRDADTLIIDTHFTPGESFNFKGWGHGNFGNAVDLARLAKVKHLILFHHNFNKTDKELFETEVNVRGYLALSKDSFQDMNLQISVAYEGLEIEL